MTSWDVLFNEDYAGHISMWDDGPGAVTVSSYIHGYDETAITDEQLAAHRSGVDRPEAAEPALLGLGVRQPVPRGHQRRDLGRLRLAGLLLDRARRGRPGGVRQPGRKAGTRGSGCTASAPRPTAPSSRSQFLDQKLAELTCSNAVTLFYYGCAQRRRDGGHRGPVHHRGLRHSTTRRSWRTRTSRRTSPRSSATRGPRCGRASRPSRPALSRSASPPARPMLGRRGALRFLAVPPYLWLGLFFVLPLVLIIAISFRPESGPIDFDDPWNLTTGPVPARLRDARPTCGCWASRSSWRSAVAGDRHACSPTRSPTS